jgi:hypothetical protein
MSKFEKRLCIFALVFVAIYLGAAALTIHSRLSKEDKVERIESLEMTPGEKQLLIAELFLPAMILLTLTVCFIIIRKQRAKKLLQLEESDNDFE